MTRPGAATARAGSSPRFRPARWLGTATEFSSQLKLVVSGMAGTRFAMRGSHQFLEDAAVGAVFITTTAAGLEQQLLFTRTHALEPRPPLFDLLLHQPVHIRVRLARCVQRAQQSADVGQWHLQCAAVADEGQ